VTPSLPFVDGLTVNCIHPMLLPMRQHLVCMMALQAMLTHLRVVMTPPSLPAGTASW
jgi:hypothetical protein